MSERTQYGNQQGVDQVANLLMGVEEPESGETSDAKPDDIERAPEAAATPAETPNADDLLAELLADPEREPQASAPERAQTIDSLEQLAESAGVEVSRLYDIAVPMADGGEPMTIGELKDAMQTRSTFQQEREAFETQRITQEASLMRARTELQQLIGLLGQDKLTPQLIEHVRNEQARYLQEQQSQLLAMRPEWADPEKGQAAQREIAGAMEAYGFSPAEREAIADARVLKAFHDLATYRKRIDAANERVKEMRSGREARPAAPRGRRGSTQTGVDKLVEQAKQADQPRDKVNAAAALIAAGAKQ